MDFQGKSIRLTALDDGFVELCFDLEGESVNKFDQQTLTELREAATALAGRGDLRGLLVTSAKPGYFIVGADITEFTGMFQAEEDELLRWVSEGASIFNIIEDLPFPSVTAINGVAMGGGLEMCLATDCRVMAASTKIGLPEVKLGILPGFGGTVRLTRVIGIDNAVEWIASGKDYRAQQALAFGTVDAVVSDELLREAALDLLRQCADGKLDWRAKRQEKLEPVKLNDVERMMAIMTGKSVVAAQAGPNMPAPVTIVKSIERSAGLPRDEALAVEAKSFVKLAKTPQAGALVGLFLNDQQIQKLARQHAKAAAPVQSAAVLGAGTMGGGIAYQSASCGIPILMKDIAQEGLDLGMAEAAKLLGKQVDRGRLSAAEMATTLGRIRPQLDYDGIGDTDCVVEAVVENAKVKKVVLAECEALLKDGAVLTSNTSTISISLLAEALQRPDMFCGMHFFNPVHRMPLVEVIRGEQSSDAAIATAVAFARALKKSPIVVNDCPGFLVNRILFPYFGAFNMLLRDGGDLQQIDRVMERFGWPMGPAYLLDVVGLDVGHHAAAVMAEGIPERFSVDFKPASDLLFEAGRLGQKSGAGFYRYETDRRGRPSKLVDPEVATLLAPALGEAREYSAEDITARLMVPMCNEAVRCLDEGIVSSPAELDMALVLGIGFPPYRGGALRYIDQTGLGAYCDLADSLAELGPAYVVPDSLRSRAASNRPFFA